MRFSLGINYWPRRSAMHMWQRFDPGEIADDMARIAELGFDAVRFFLRWADFQPEPYRMDSTMLARLERMMELIAATGLRAMPTLFCGHMSGVNWLPSWALDRSRPAGRFRTITETGEAPYGCADFYGEPFLETQRFHVREAGAALRGHPAVLAWDLGNEFSNVREPASTTDASEWSKRLTYDLQSISGHPVTGGLHGEDLTQDRNIRPSSIAEPWIFTTMHGYSVYSEFARSRTDPDVVPFLATVSASLSGKPVLFSEFGNPTCPPGKRSPYDRVPLPGEPPLPDIASDDPELSTYACLDEGEMAVYARDVLDRLHAEGRLGGYWWCWADYHEELRSTPPFDRAPHELTFGIVRADGTTKPVATALSVFAREARSVVEPHDPVMFEPAYYAGLPSTIRDAYARFLEFHL
jgi:endo-1,4-beta-mannosidase